MVSTTIAAIGPMVEEFQRTMPEADIVHLLDEGLVIEFGRSGGLSRAAKFRTLELCRAAEAAEAKIVVCSCSTLSPAFAEIEPFVNIPLVPIDTAMAEEACRIGGRVAVLTTAASVHKSVIPTLNRVAAAVGRQPEWVPIVLEGVRGMPRSSPELFAAVADGVDKALLETDLAIVAQCSMVGCMPFVPEGAHDKVLTAPPYAVRATRALAEQLGLLKG